SNNHDRDALLGAQLPPHPRRLFRPHVMAVGRVLDWHSDLAESFGPHTGLVECNGAHVPVLVVTNPHVLTTDPLFHGHGEPPSRPKSTAPRRWQPESKDPDARPTGPAWWPGPGAGRVPLTAAPTRTSTRCVRSVDPEGKLITIVWARPGSAT